MVSFLSPTLYYANLHQDLATPPQYQQGRLFFCNTLASSAAAPGLRWLEAVGCGGQEQQDQPMAGGPVGAVGPDTGSEARQAGQSVMEAG
ncbi:hypothetical protein HaLaN_24913 [Haematococcus lacustris]|uniref:Uncharacterized protein n=1 Tax=Haematococcus lacustris TaxID=44745 RepID=A0A6A0A3X3_HAELA|nr:hypothetical protein HaLaN_24913 [Haematococcus lacustris]